MLRAPALIALVAACAPSEPPPLPAWSVEMEGLSAGLLSVWGTNESDIWTVGGDPAGSGPAVFHFDGTSWSAMQTGVTGDLWWVFGFEGGPVYMGGAGGLILRHQDGSFQRMTTPSNGTVFGIWGASPDELWAVGGASGGASGGFAWRLDGDRWIEAPGFPQELEDEGAIWKVWGRGANDVWLVGTFGTTVHWDGSAFTVQAPLVQESLFTVHSNASRFVSVGGFGTGIILENEGGTWKNVSPNGANVINGVCLTPDGGWAVGFDGAVYTRGDMGWKSEETGLDIYETLHAVWVDPKGGVWAVGGDVLSFPLIDGVLVHRSPGGNE
jgi:hypothetical protein